MKLPKSVVTVALLMVAFAGFGFGVLSFENVRSYLDSFAGDGSAEPYTPGIHLRLRVIAILGGFSLLVLSIVVWRTYDRLTVRFAGTYQNHRRHFARAVSLWRALLRRNGWWLCSLTLLAVGLRLPYLSQPIRYDEANTYLHFAQYPWFVGISLYEDPNNHVFHTLCMRICSQLFGEELWAIRLPAFVAGVLTVPATFVTARLLGGRKAGIVAGSIVAVSSVMIEYSTNARGYTIVCLCTVLALFTASLIYRAIYTGRSQRLDWHLLVLVSAMGLWTIPVMLYPLAMIWSFLLLALVQSREQNRGKLLLTWTVSGLTTAIVTLALYSPVLIVSGWRSVVANRYVRPLSWAELLEELPGSMLDTFRLLARDWPLVAQAVLATGIAMWLFRGFAPGGRRKYSPIILVSAIVCLTIVATQRVAPPARVWTFLMPLLAVFSAAGLADMLRWIQPPKRRLIVLIVALALLAAGPVVNEHQSRSILRSPETGVCPDAEQVVLLLKDRFKTASDSTTPIVAIAPVSAPIVFYARRHKLAEEHFDFPDRQSIDSSVVLVTQTLPQSVESVFVGLDLDDIGDAESFQPRETFPTVTLYQRDIDETGQ